MNAGAGAESDLFGEVVAGFLHVLGVLTAKHLKGEQRNTIIRLLYKHDIRYQGSHRLSKIFVHDFSVNIS